MFSSAYMIRRVALLLVVLFVLVAPKHVLAEFSATLLDEYENVTIMEVSGNYDAYLPDGSDNMAPRREIAKEFYKTHGDDYDFLVIFTNFDILMPNPNVKAFFNPAKNDVQGIGKDLYDYTWGYTPDESYLNRLEGTIDMATMQTDSLSGHVMDPADPDFEKTLLGDGGSDQVKSL